MPRQIIDTESSRPAYERRVMLRWAIVLIVFIGLVLAGVAWWRAHGPPAHAAALANPGNAARVVNLGPVPHQRREYAA
jgi:hypothetical protein